MNETTANKHDVILKAALRLFTERGFHNTPTSLIAKEAGVATGTLFHHFKNKEELINELYLTIKQGLLAEMKDGFNAALPIADIIRDSCVRALKWGILHPKEYQFLQQFANSPFISAITREQASMQFEFICEIYEQAMQQEIIKTCCPEFIPFYFEGALIAAMSYFRQYPERISEEHIHELFTLCWEGIAR